MTAPGRLVRTALRTARLPLTVTETLAGMAGFDMSRLPPVVAYDLLEGRAKQVAGWVLGDVDLAREGGDQQRAASGAPSDDDPRRQRLREEAAERRLGRLEAERERAERRVERSREKATEARRRRDELARIRSRSQPTSDRE